MSQAKLSLEIARQLSDPVAAAQVRLNAATFLAEAEEIEQQARTVSTPQTQSDGKKHWTQNNDQGGAPLVRLSDPDQGFCAGYEEPELKSWRNTPPLSLNDLFNNPAVQERGGKVIARAMNA